MMLLKIGQQKNSSKFETRENNEPKNTETVKNACLYCEI